MSPPALSDWYRVRFDERRIYRDASPPGGEAWSDRFEWSEITRVCYYAGDLFESDEIYFFTASRAESYVVPTEADGGSALWSEVLDRGLFDATLAIEAMGATGQLFCDPAPEAPEKDE